MPSGGFEPVAYLANAEIGEALLDTCAWYFSLSLPAIDRAARPWLRLAKFLPEFRGGKWGALTLAPSAYFFSGSMHHARVSSKDTNDKALLLIERGFDHLERHLERRYTHPIAADLAEMLLAVGAGAILARAGEVHEAFFVILRARAGEAGYR